MIDVMIHVGIAMLHAIIPCATQWKAHAWIGGIPGGDTFRWERHISVALPKRKLIGLLFWEAAIPHIILHRGERAYGRNVVRMGRCFKNA